MSVVSVTVPVSLEEVFDTLMDPHTYPDWLVGARQIRHVDPEWPRPGSRFHHTVGLGGPATVADTTKLLAVVPPAKLVLEARARPLGRARVSFELSETSDGTEVLLEERPLGILSLAEPVVGIATRRRNRRSLERLAELLAATGGTDSGV